MVSRTEVAPAHGEVHGKLHSAITNSDRIRGLTHQFYRYPARFSPEFARAIIDAFSEPGDVIVYPFVGGGTTVVEALATGRRVVGSDLNPLSVFLTEVKTTPLSHKDVQQIGQWAAALPHIRVHHPVEAAPPPQTYRHVPWWIRKPLQQALGRALLLDPRPQRFARAVLLEAAQWALDSRKDLPSKSELLNRAIYSSAEMLRAIESFALQIRNAFDLSPAKAVIKHSRVRHCNAAEFSRLNAIPKSWKPAKLLLMSPPYQGVHILYHRWQVQGRRETPAPYWLAGLQDGRPESFYTFASRKHKTGEKYLRVARSCLQGVLPALSDSAVIVQLIGFADPAAQLPAYLAMLEDIGLEEHPVVAGHRDRWSRAVPNRRWYASPESSATEFLLIHHLARKPESAQ